MPRKCSTTCLITYRPPSRKKNARIERKGPLPTVMGHRVVLEAAFSNLLSNALKFVPPQVIPEVTVWPEEQEREVRIWFADNGIGIDAQHQQRIFEVSSDCTRKSLSWHWHWPGDRANRGATHRAGRSVLIAAGQGQPVLGFAA